jgi:hypothetical protein
VKSWFGAGCALLAAAIPAAAGGPLFGCTGTGMAPSDLVRIDPATGAAALVGPMGIDGCGGLAFAPGTAVLFASGEEAATGRSGLFSVDVATGAATLIGPTGADDLRDRVADLSFRGADGALFAFLGRSRDLARIHPLTGTLTRVGATGTGSLRSGGGLAFDADDTLLQADDLSINRLNPESGRATAGPEMVLPDVECPEGFRVNALTADPGGGLLASLNCGMGPAAAPIYLADLDPATGTVAVRGETVPGLDGLAFAPSVCAGACTRPDGVSVADLVRCIEVALSRLERESCRACDADYDGAVTVRDLVAAVRHAMIGCP